MFMVNSLPLLLHLNPFVGGLLGAREDLSVAIFTSFGNEAEKLKGPIVVHTPNGKVRM